MQFISNIINSFKDRTSLRDWLQSMYAEHATAIQVHEGS